MEWKMNLDDIVQYINEDSIRGDLSRELAGIISDYHAGAITVEDKELLVNEVLNAFQAQNLAEDEVMLRWAVSAATLVTSIV
jgi:hypothetical protein